MDQFHRPFLLAGLVAWGLDGPALSRQQAAKPFVLERRPGIVPEPRSLPRQPATRLGCLDTIPPVDLFLSLPSIPLAKLAQPLVKFGPASSISPSFLVGKNLLFRISRSLSSV